MIFNDIINSKKPLAKINQIALLITTCFAIIVGRLINLQIYQGAQLNALSMNNFTRVMHSQSPRGNICDINFNLLATNRPVKNLVWLGTGKRLLTETQKQKLEKVCLITGLHLSAELLKKIQAAERLEQELVICGDISFAALSKIEEQFTDDQNIAILSSVKRFYPYEKLASHIIGYLGTMNVNKEGKMGLERIFEESLRGTPGTKKLTINSLGKQINDTEITQTVTGATIRTTLDLELQKICEECFDEQYTGSFIIMDPKTGAILSLLSRPNFNPAIFLDPLSDEMWNQLREKKPFINRALGACYPPASIFKLITVASGIELGLINPESHFRCNGHVVFSDRKYHCHNQNGHGTLTIREALAQSCNILFYKLGKIVSIDVLADYAQKFGLGAKTGIILPELEGLIPTTAWKIRTKGERWWIGETLSASIGQSYLLATPIQIARMISALFDGYLSKPRILADEPIIKQKLEIRPSTLEFLRESMKLAVTSGTGRRVDKIANLTIYAKTGTAQTCALDKESSQSSNLSHAWFVGNFGYKNEAPLTIVLMVENAGSTKIAITIARKFFNQYRTLMARRTNKN